MIPSCDLAVAIRFSRLNAPTYETDQRLNDGSVAKLVTGFIVESLVHKVEGRFYPICHIRVGRKLGVALENRTKVVIAQSATRQN